MEEKLFRNLSCTCYLLVCIDESCDIFPVSYLSRPLAAYQHLSDCNDAQTYNHLVLNELSTILIQLFFRNTCNANPDSDNGMQDQKVTKGM